MATPIWHQNKVCFIPLEIRAGLSCFLLFYFCCCYFVCLVLGGWWLLLLFSHQQEELHFSPGLMCQSYSLFMTQRTWALHCETSWITSSNNTHTKLHIHTWTYGCVYRCLIYITTTCWVLFTLYCVYVFSSPTTWNCTAIRRLRFL